MPFKDGRRAYYDHETAYQKIAAKGGTGWDALTDQMSHDSYDGVEEFLNSPFTACLNAGQTVLDQGCGGGQVAMMFAKRGCVVFGIDYSPTAVSLARANARKAGLRINFREGDCLTLQDFADRCMDIVVDNHVWHCIVGRDDRRAFLQSAHRVLKPGGLMFCETMTREGDFSPSVVSADPSTFVSGHHNRYWTSIEEALKELHHAGFEVLQQRLKPQPHEPGAGDLFITYSRRA